MKRVTKPRASVVLCTIRLEENKECLKSLANQTFENFEVILVDGRRDKKLVKVVNSFKKTLRIKRVTTNERNLSKARNIGIKYSRGSIIAFIDDDAVATPEWLERIVGHFKDNKRSLAVGGLCLSATKDYLAQAGQRFLQVGFTKRQTRLLPGMSMATDLKRLRAVIKQHKVKRDLTFDESCNRAGEDTELCLFICDVLKVSPWFDPDIIVTHYYRSNFKEFIRRQFDYAFGDSYVSLLMPKSSIVNSYIVFDVPRGRLTGTRTIIKELIKEIVFFCKKYGLIWLPAILVKEIAYLYGLKLALYALQSKKNFKFKK